MRRSLKYVTGQRNTVGAVNHKRQRSSPTNVSLTTTEVRSVCRRYQNDHGGWLTRLTGIPVMLIGMLMRALVNFSFSSVLRIMSPLPERPRGMVDSTDGDSCDVDRDVDESAR